MVIFQGKSRRKSTGGRLKPHSKKRKVLLGRVAAETRIGERRVRRIKTKGGGTKIRLLMSETVNLVEAPGERARVVKILGVQNNPASRDFTRRNVITKGAVIETEAGLAMVTSRPGQDSVINAVKIEEEKQV
jgi:small subunit ribosomal protein S8e